MSFPVYQIDFSAVLTGKRVASSKRRLRWRFGFPNQEAIRNGETGTACRGEEHDVTIVWSITSGKRQISCDGREVHFSTNRAGILDFSWSMKGNHVIKIVAHAMPPVNVQPGFRQYDLSVDGQPFHLMPKVYELGVSGAGQSPRVPGVYDQTQRAYMPPSQGPANPEDADLQRAIDLSLQEAKQHLGGSYPAPAPTYDSAPAPAYAPAPVPPVYDTAIVQHQTPGPSYNYGGAQSVVAPQVSSPSNQSDAASFVSAPPLQPSGPPTDFMTGPTPSEDLLNPVSAVPPADDPFAPKPAGPTNHYDVANMIMGAYGAPPPAAPAAQAPPVAQAPPAVPSTPQNQPPPAQYQQSPPPQYQTPQLTNGTAGQAPPPPAENGAPPATTIQLSMNALTLHEDEKKEEKNDVNSAMRKLVNFDNIDEAPEDLTLTMKPKEDPNAKKRDPSKSVPLPPKAVGVINTGASLEQIKTVAPSAPGPDPSKVMSPPPNLYPPGHPANAGALVVHGQGPPPLQKEFVGFGVGAQMRQQQQMQQQMQQQQAAYGGVPPPQYPGAPPAYSAPPPMYQQPPQAY